METIPNSYNWFPAIFLCLSAFGFCFGLSGIPLSYSNELIPADVRLVSSFKAKLSYLSFHLRSKLFSITVCLVPLENFVLTKCLPSLITNLGVFASFFTLGGLSLLSIIWGVVVLPETRGLTSLVSQTN